MENHDHKRTVRIHIDQKRYESPSPTKAEALYLLANIAEGFELYREVDGNREGDLIPRGPEVIHLKEGDHFHSKPIQNKDITIIVNARKKVVHEKELSFNQVVALAFDPVPTGPNIVITVTYRNGPRANPEGTMRPREVVKIQDGMTFNVTATDKS